MGRLSNRMEERSLPKDTKNRLNLLVWRRELQRKKAEMLEEEKEKGSKILKEPIMREEDLMRIVNKQRNGKSAGIDGVKAEVMKYMIKNRKIKLHLLKSFNKCLYDDIHKDWLLLIATMIAKTGSQ